MTRRPMLAAAITALALAACGSDSGPTAGSVDDPCTLTTRADAARAFDDDAPAGKRAGTRCEYELGGQNITVEARRDGTDAAPKAAGEFQRNVSGPGYTGLARTYVPPNPASGSQAGVLIRRGPASVSILLTDTGKAEGSLLGPVAVLGRAAAAHLAAAEKR